MFHTWSTVDFSDDLSLPRSINGIACIVIHRWFVPFGSRQGTGTFTGIDAGNVLLEITGRNSWPLGFAVMFPNTAIQIRHTINQVALSSSLAITTDQQQLSAEINDVSAPTSRHGNERRIWAAGSLRTPFELGTVRLLH
ncbi:hypothetical protein J6590_015225 [Homalodisca vitripennis]|nr:hypothetical protein J6590_015225 [Homalodisca vitripennis]